MKSNHFIAFINVTDVNSLYFAYKLYHHKLVPEEFLFIKNSYKPEMPTFKNCCEKSTTDFCIKFITGDFDHVITKQQFDQCSMSIFYGSCLDYFQDLSVKSMVPLITFNCECRYDSIEIIPPSRLKSIDDMVNYVRRIRMINIIDLQKILIPFIEVGAKNYGKLTSQL